MADYSISKDPTATNLTHSKNSTNKVTISKNPGFTKAYFTKSGGTIVAVGKGDTSGSYGPPILGIGTALTLEDGATALTLEDGATALVLEDF
jgi:hypothetical protein